MKKVSIILSAVMIAAAMLSSCGEDSSKGEDDSNSELKYDEVTIGTQVWMTKNLEVTHFRNGDVIPEAKSVGEWKAYADAGEAAWCYYNNQPLFGGTYGKLYNWYAVSDPRGLAPKGYHVPTDQEWTILTDYLGGKEKAGTKMKSKIDWPNDGIGTNSSGFSGLPGGSRNSNGAFIDVVKGGGWWSSTEDGTGIAWYRSLSYRVGYVYRNRFNKEVGFSVRCLRD